MSVEDRPLRALRSSFSDHLLDSGPHAMPEAGSSLESGNGTPVASLDLAHLYKLRVAVGRFGEMDTARWWNTQEVLGPRGETVYRRGLPKTHFFAQARVVLTVAARRSAEVYRHRPGEITLWEFSAARERALDRAVQDWQDRAAEWDLFFRAIQACDGTDLLGWLEALDLINGAVAAEARTLRRSADGRAVLLPGALSEGDTTVRLLAAAFFRGEPQRLAVPYARTMP